MNIKVDACATAEMTAPVISSFSFQFLHTCNCQKHDTCMNMITKIHLSWITNYQNTIWISPLVLCLPTVASHFRIGTYSRIKTNRLPHTLSSA